MRWLRWDLVLGILRYRMSNATISVASTASNWSYRMLVEVVVARLGSVCLVPCFALAAVAEAAARVLPDSADVLACGVTPFLISPVFSTSFGAQHVEKSALSYSGLSVRHQSLLMLASLAYLSYDAPSYLGKVRITLSLTPIE